MALCSNSTSLLSLAFGLNAVYAALATQVTGMRVQLAGITVAHFKAVDPAFEVAPGERAVMESWVSRTYKGYKLAVWLRLFPLVLSISLMLISAGTLYQNAIWDKCYIDDKTLGVLVAVALFVAPATYFSFSVLLTYIVRAIETKAFKNKEATVALIDIYRLCLNAHADLEDARAMIWKAEQMQAEMHMREFRDLLSNWVHPVRTVSEWHRTYRVNRMVKKLLSEEASSHPAVQGTPRDEAARRP